MFGAIMDAAMMIPQNMMMEEDRNQRQMYQYGFQSDQNAFNSAEAVRARGWSEQMQNTAHQRQVADLRAAGLNPILSARMSGAGSSGGVAASGGGASSPGGSIITGRSGADFASSAAAIKLTEAQEDLVKEQKWNTMMDTSKKDKERTYYHMLGQRTEHEIEGAKHQAEILSNSAKGAELEGEIDETTYGKIMRYLNRAVRSVTGGASAYRNLEGR